MSNVFKAYDIRGIYPEEINKDLAFNVGGATVKFLEAKSAGLRNGKKLNLVVGEDCRLSSPTLRGAVIDALTKAGANVSYIGLCTTPLFYFSVNKLKADGGIMVTASHNPAQYGGLKIVGYESSPIGVDNGLQEIEKIANAGFDYARNEGKVDEMNLVDDYIDFLIKDSGVQTAKLQKLKFIIDAGNGMTPIVLTSLMEKLKLQYTPLYFDVDCSFPNHSPDISRKEALIELSQRVHNTKSDIGVAFDGDGDRVMFVNEKGDVVRADYILALLFKNSKKFFMSPKVVYDLRVSRSVKKLFGSNGYRSRPGHSFIKQVMREHRADLGAELSGHMFFKEMLFAESSILAMLKVLKIVADSGKPMSQLIKPFEQYFHSGEINIEIDSREQGTEIINRLKDKYKDGQLDELDGVTVEYPSWWFNLRLSNTEPKIRLVVEADTKEAMEKKIGEISFAIKMG